MLGLSKNVLYRALAIAAPFFLYTFYLTHHLSLPFQNYFTDDARAQIAPFYESLKIDYIAQYYRDAFSPPGWRILFDGASTFLDPLHFGNFLGYFLWGVMLLLLGVSAHTLGGIGAVFGVLLLAIPSPIFFDRMMGGLPRAFAFPAIALGIYAALNRKYRLLFWNVPISALFYPVNGIFLGIFFCFVTFTRKNISVGARSFLALLVWATLALSFVPQYLAGKNYGERLTYADVDRFPEVGTHGRFGGAENPPYPSMLSGIQSYSKVTFMPREHPHLEEFVGLWKKLPRKIFGKIRRWKSYLLYGLLASCVIYLVSQRKIESRDSETGVRILLLFLASVAVAYQASVLAAPYLFHPQRYLVFTLPIGLLLLVTTAVSHCSRRISSKPLFGIILFLCIHLLIGGYGKNSIGFMEIKPPTHAFLRQLQILPKDSLLAGWPTGVVNNIPLITQRKVLLSYETHQVFHERYVQEMRERMHATVEAYFSPDESGIVTLKEKYGVTHFIIDRRLFDPRNEDAKHRATYFEPFSELIREKNQFAKSSWLYTVPQSRCIVSHGPLCVIAL